MRQEFDVSAPRTFTTNTRPENEEFQLFVITNHHPTDHLLSCISLPQLFSVFVFMVGLEILERSTNNADVTGVGSTVGWSKVWIVCKTVVSMVGRMVDRLFGRLTSRFCR